MIKYVTGGSDVAILWRDGRRRSCLTAVLRETYRTFSIIRSGNINANSALTGISYNSIALTVHFVFETPFLFITSATFSVTFQCEFKHDLKSVLKSLLKSYCVIKVYT